MSDFLEINRNGQILEIVLDRPKANALDAPPAGSWAKSLRASAMIRICGSRSSPGREKSSSRADGI